MIRMPQPRNAVVVAIAAVLTYGCAPAPSASTGPSTDSASLSSHEATTEMPTLGVEAALYFDPKSPVTIRSWGSYVADVTVISDGEVEQIIHPAPGGPEEPIQGPSLRSLTVKINSIDWKHPRAVYNLSVGDSIEITTADGFDTVNGKRVAVATHGFEQMRIGDSYQIALVDDFQNGKQVLEYLDGSAVPASSIEARDRVAKVETAAPGISDNVPTKGVPFGARIERYITQGE